jgi:nucleoside-diphosphate-sugar epimerase
VHVLETNARKNLEAFSEVNVGGTRSLALASIRAGVRRLVLLSSLKAMGEETKGDQCYTEDSPCRPRDAYGISKWEAEQAVWEIAAGSRMEVVILRAPLIYGPGVGANFLRLIRAIDRGTPMPLGLVRNRRSLLFVRNLTSAILSCLDHPAAGGQVFLAADPEALSTRELVRRLAKLLGRSPRLLPVPTLFLRVGAGLLGRSDDFQRLTGSLLASTSKIRQQLSWQPPFTVDDGLHATVAWYRSRASTT